MIGALHDLWYGFGVALTPHNLMWSFFGVLIGNLIGVLPGMGALSAIAMLLPLTYTMHPVPAILMLAGIFYGSQYGGAIGAILLNLPSHPPHAVTCLDGYPMTRAGKGGTAATVTAGSAGAKVSTAGFWSAAAKAAPTPGSAPAPSGFWLLASGFFPHHPRISVYAKALLLLDS